MNTPAGGQHIEAFFQSIQDQHPEVRDPAWTGEVTPWADERVAGFLRAIVADYLADYGANTRWADVAYQATFMLSALFSDDVRSGRRQAWTLQVGPLGEESFQVRLTLSRQGQVPPVPTLSGAGASEVRPVPESMFATSMARVPGQADPLQASAADLSRWFHEVSHQLALTDGRAVQATGALLALWRAAQVTGLVTAGSFFKRVRRPEVPEEAAHDIRLKFERISPMADEALEQAADGGAYLLH